MKIRILMFASNFQENVPKWTDIHLDCHISVALKSCHSVLVLKIANKHPSRNVLLS